jgi:hypothetical protein
MARTRITNMSTARKFFGFIPPHGAALDSGGSVTIDGDLRTILASGRGRYQRKVELAALDRELDLGHVDVDERPDPSSSSSASE